MSNSVHECRRAEGSLRQLASATDSNVRSLAVVAAFRLVHTNHALGMSIMQELARRSVRFGLPRPQGLALFGCCESGCLREAP